MDPSPPLDADRLLEHAAWVRRLAGQLVRDPNAADDAAQDAFAAALRSGPREESRTKAWFAAVVRSFVRRSARGDARRARREVDAAQPERVRSAAEVVERAQASRVVVNAVLELPEPYRSTILMRWFDEVAPARIAELRGEPVETVRTRLKRGHALLRERLAAELDVETTDGRKYRGLPGLALLLDTAPSHAAIGAGAGVGGILGGGLGMSFAGKLAAGVVAVAAAVAGWSLLPDRAIHQDSAVVASHASTPPEVASLPDDAAGAERSRDGETHAAPTPTTSEGTVPSVQKVPDRWKDVTVENWQELTRYDEGEAFRAAVSGLEAENLDVVAFLRFLGDSLADSYAVPGSGQTESGLSKMTVSWAQMYFNDQGERSVLLPHWSRDAKKNETTGLMLSPRFWALENASRLGFEVEQMNPWLVINLSQREDGRRTGLILLNPGAREKSVDDLPKVTAKLEQLEKDKRLPSRLAFDFDDRGGRRTWSRSGSSQELSPLERERLIALFDLLAGIGKEFTGLK